MNLLITGGNGFLGSYLKIRLNSEGINYFSPSSAELNIHSIDSINHYFVENKINKIVHLAAQADHTSDQCVQTNVMGTYNLAKVAKEHSVQQFLFASTNNVYGAAAGSNTFENDATIPINLYGDSKLIGEYVIKSTFNENHAILRYSDIYGINQKYGNLMKKFIENSLEDKPNVIYGTGKRTRDYLYVEDAVRAILHILKNEISGTFNVSTGIGTSTSDLSSAIGTVFRCDKQTQYVEAMNDDESVVVLNNDRLIDSGFNIEYSLVDGLSDMKRRMNNDEKN